MMKQWRKLVELQSWERVYLIQASVLLPLVAVALRIFGFRRVYSALIRLQQIPLTKGGGWRRISRGISPGIATGHPPYPQATKELIEEHPTNCPPFFRGTLGGWNSITGTATPCDRKKNDSRARDRLSPLAKGDSRGSVLRGLRPPPNPLLTKEGSIRSSQAQLSSEEATRLARMVRLAARYGPHRANCLKQSLVIWWLLRQRGLETALRIGVRKEEEQFEAHAWIECLGRPLNEGADIHERFVPFDQILSQEVNWT